MGQNISDMSQKQIATPENLLILKNVRVKEHEKEVAVAKKKGDVVSVSGMDKLQLLATKSAGRITEEINSKNIDKPCRIRLTHSCIIKEHNQDKESRRYEGEIVTVSGLDKAVLIIREEGEILKD